MEDKRFSLASRLIHWAMAFTFLYLMLTVFLRIGFMNGHAMSDTISHGLTEKGITADKDTTREIAHHILHPMWETHELAGYIMLGLYIIRMIITFKQGAAFPSPFKTGISGKNRFKSWVYVIFYVLLAVSLVSALLMEFGPQSIGHEMEELHEKGTAYMIAFILLHTAGVLGAELGGERGIVSKMISGNKPQ